MTSSVDRIVVFGGGSQIGLAVAEAILREGGAEVVLVGRPGSPHRAGAHTQMVRAGARTVTWVDWDAADFASYRQVTSRVFVEQVDVVVVAVGVLGPAQAWRDFDQARQMVSVNAAAPICLGALLAEHLADQRGGQIIVLSSVAAERVRGANVVYGATKSATDGFYRQLGYKLRPYGVSTLVVRPGAVRGRMTAGRRVALMVSPAQVGRASWRAARRGRSVVRIPRVFDLLMGVFKYLPESWAARM